MMANQSLKKSIFMAIGAIACFCLGMTAFAATSGVGIGAVAGNVKGNLGSIAQLITAGAYVAGMGFGVGAIVKFKAHKDNPTQVAISVPIAMLFIAAALLYVPSVFESTGKTLFVSGSTAGISGVQSF
jgi:intracellular multiplication protein IcmD